MKSRFKMLLEISLFFGLIIFIDYLRRSYMTRTIRNIPLVSRLPFIGSFLALSDARPDNLLQIWRKFILRHGKSFHSPCLGRLVIVTADHRIVNPLLNNSVNLRKNQFYNFLNVWLGSGLLISSGKLWQTMRKIITPTFHFKILEDFVEVFDRQSEIFIRKLKTSADGQTVVDISMPMSLLALDIIAESAMGVTLNVQLDSKSEFVQAVTDVTEVVANRFTKPYLAFPTLFKILYPEYYKIQMKGVHVMHKFTEKIIADRKKAIQTTSSNSAVDDTNDLGIKKRMALLDVLLQSTMDDGKPLPDKQIRDEVNTFMFEGHDTTTVATSFCLYALSRHVKIQQKLFEEIRNHFGDDLERPITYADLQQLNYLNCVIKESLRLYPPIPAIGRWLEHDIKLDECILPAGANIIMLLYEMMRDPDIFKDPSQFRPERHLETSSKANSYSNIPFSAGPRNCVGQRFALFEMRTVIVKMLRHYELLPLGDEMRLVVTVVLRSSNGVNLGLKPRNYNQVALNM